MAELDDVLRDWESTPEVIDRLIEDPELLRRTLLRLVEEPDLVGDLPPQLQQFLASVLRGA
jgi:hypothetical protein